MISIETLRKDPEAVRSALARKKFRVDLDQVLELDRVRREAISRAESRRADQKAANAAMSALAKGSADFLAKVAEMKAIAEEAKALEAVAKEADQAFQDAVMTIPNLPDPSIPDGRGEADNVEVRVSGNLPEKPAHVVPHWDLPGFEQMVDFERGVKVTGAGFPFYVGPVARLVRALVRLFLDRAAEAGFVELHCPILVNPASATATGQLPDKEGQMYPTSTDDLYLIPTAEVPVTNLLRGEILERADLPVKHCAWTPCFRREAGSWGKDVRGLNRLHQFDKVELVLWVHPEESSQYLQRIVAHGEGILKELNLPYRTLEICSGDIGFPHSRQYDLEVYALGQERWLEVSSCSNFTDFQARRANIRFRGESGKPEFVHTLNGSALAVPRILAALLENGYDGTGEIWLPPVLSEYFGADSLRLPER
ncbi:MAG: serine--tRNA ligase [Puniceicoccaceae bacterium]